jgi:CubicO group peptidase (beta-lactamase class C family)
VRKLPVFFRTPLSPIPTRYGLRANASTSTGRPKGSTALRSRRRRTRALVVVHGGRIVAERYAPEFDATMPLLGWSMSKMAINALVGIAVQDGEANSGR